jgi:phage tail-like protein
VGADTSTGREFERPFVGAETTRAWGEWALTNAAVDDDGVSVALASAPSYVRPTPAFPTWPEGVTVVDVDVGDCGTVYVLGARESSTDGVPRGVVYQYVPQSESLRRVACLSDDEWFADPRAISVTDDDIYVATGAGGGGVGEGDGTGTGGRLYAFSRHLRHLRWVDEERFHDPVAMVDDGTRAYVLDGGRGGESPVDPFLAVAGTDGSVDVLGVDDGVSLTAPLDVAIDAAGTLYVLDAGPIVRVFRGDAAGLTTDPQGVWVDTAVFPTALDDAGDETPVAPSSLEAVDTGVVVVGLAPESVGEPTLFRYDHDLARFERLSGYRGHAAGLRFRRVAAGARPRGLHVIHGDGSGVTFLAEVLRHRRDSRTGRYEARVDHVLDSGAPETQWHRLTLDADVTETGTQVTVRYAAADDRATLDGESQPWRTLDPDPTDALFDEAVGRYLRLDLRLVGTESATPRVRGLRAYFPRDSYLRYLPAVYREDAESAAFLERFLSVFESTYVVLEADLAHVTRFFDPAGIPDESLSWLGEWLALEADETWSASATRDLLAAAPRLYKQRGTRAGLLSFVDRYLAGDREARANGALADGSEDEAGDDDGNGDAGDDGSTGEDDTGDDGSTGEDDTGDDGSTADGDTGDGSEGDSATEATGATAAVEAEAEDPLVFVWEFADLDCITDPEARAPYAALVGCPQCLVVLVHPSVPREAVRGVERIVDTQTPAHAFARTVRLQPWVELGGHSYLGVNSRLPTRELAVETAVLGKDSVLTAAEPFAELERQSRLGEDMTIS